MNRNQNSTDYCENLLIEIRDSNKENQIFPSENKIIELLLCRSNEMKESYVEIHKTLGHDSSIAKIFLNVIVNTAALFNPDKLSKARSNKLELESTNYRISELANELATLLNKRDMLHNTSGFSSNTYYHILEILDDAGTSNSLYKSSPRDKLKEIKAQYDLKYWPSIPDVILRIANDAENARIYAYDSIIEISTASRKDSIASFIRALYKAISDNCTQNYGLLPLNYNLTYKNMATIINCMLNLPIDNLVTEDQIKSLKQRDKSKSPKT